MTTAALAIRPLGPDDQDVWWPLWRAYLAFYDTELPAETVRVTWARLLDPAEPMFGALAIEDGRAVGLVHWIYHRSCWTIGDYCYLQDLYVDAGRRGGGIGRRLIDHVAEVARAAGSSRVHWLTMEDNATARRLYDRVADRPGFIQYRKLLQ